MQREARQKQYRKINRAKKCSILGLQNLGSRKRATATPPHPLPPPTSTSTHQDPLVAYVGLKVMCKNPTFLQRYSQSRWSHGSRPFCSQSGQHDTTKRNILPQNQEDIWQQAQGPKTPRPITVHFKKRPSSSVLEVGMWYLL